jgi:hypothetical protein
MLLRAQSEDLERGFAEGEAGLRLEGLKPTPFGLSLRDLALDGAISLEIAQAESRVHYSPNHRGYVI